MNALPRKDMSDERDEPLASEDEVEHEDDSVDVELWKKKLVKWEEEEVIRKAEEEERLREAERQRREYEENMRKFREEQARLYEEQLAQEQMRREEQRRLLLEASAAQEDMEEGDESWDEENYDEYGNPIDNGYNNGLMDEAGMVCNEYGEPVEMVTVPGMFSDFGNYKTSVDILGTALQSVKGQAMAADWDDWGEAEEMETDTARATEPEVPQFLSMVAHTVTQSASGMWSASAASHSVTNPGTKSECVIDTEVTEEDCLVSSVTHIVSTQRTTDSSHVEAVVCKLQHQAFVSVGPREAETMEAGGDKIAQVDGINDESSDEDMEQDDEDEHLVPDAEKPQAESVNFPEDSDSSMSVQDVTLGQSENNQRDDKSDSDTEVEQDLRGEERDDSSEDDEDSKDSVNRHDNNEISNEAGESRNYDRHGDASDNYASDFDDEVNERRHSDDESSVSTEGYVQDDVRDPDTKDDAPEVQSDSDIEEVEEIEEVTETRRPHYDDEDDDDEERDEQYDEENERASESEQEEESEYEEEDISEDIPVKQPCILVFDSLGGRKDRQARLCAVLRDYLTMEYQEKYPGQKREFSTKTIPGCAPKVPQQPNLTDCGIYVCHNVETFFKSPIQDYTLPITSLKNWFPGSETRAKRGDVATLIRRLATEQNQDKLERLIWPEMVFVEPEKPKFLSEPEQRRSDGESEREDDDDISDDEYYSDEDRNDRRQKRYRSDNSSDEDRSPQRRRKDDSDSDNGFDASAVYGARAEPAPLRNLPPGISISRSSESAGPRTPGDYSQSPRQDYPTPLRRLPPGISISKQASDPTPPVASSPSPPPRRPPPRPRPAPVTPEDPVIQEVTSPMVSTQRPHPGRRQMTYTSGSEDEETTEVRVKSLFDDGDDNVQVFDLDKPAHMRTFLSPNSFRTLQEQQQYWASVRAAEASNLDTSFSSMTSHQVAHEVLESCLTSMVAHQVMRLDDTDDQQDQENVPQLDGMEDFDSEDELQVEAAESVPVNEDVAHQAAEIPLAENVASEDINQPVEIGEDSTGMSEEFSLPETTTEHGAQPDLMAASEFSGNMNNIFVGEMPQEIVTDPQSSNLPTEVAVDSMEQLVPGGESVLDTQELMTEETVELEHDIVPEAQLADLQASEVNGDFASAEDEERGQHVEAFGELVSDGQIENLQDAEINVGGFVNAAEEQQGNVGGFVEEQGNAEEFGELVENEDMEEGAPSEDFNEEYEDYASDYEEDSQGPQEDYGKTEKISQYQPPQKRARMSSDDEVVLDSDEDDAPTAPQAAPLHSSYPPRGKSI